MKRSKSLVPGFAALLMYGLNLAAAAEENVAPSQPQLLTNLLQLRLSAERRSLVLHPFRIVADVLDADSASGVLVLRDSSGSEFIHLDFKGQEIRGGDKLLLEGRNCGEKLKSFGLTIVPGMVIDNDGLHGMRLVSGTAFLHAGVNPITLQWFNGLEGFGLDVEYEGPDLPYQPIPSAALSRAKVDPATGTTNFSPGVDYRSYEGNWTHLPDFARHRPTNMGVATNFGLHVLVGRKPVALEFTGCITISQDGAYTFHLTSDDGSRLFVGESSLEFRVMSHGPEPQGSQNVPATVPERSSRPWLTLEGTVEFAGVRGAGGELVMRVGPDDIRVSILGGGRTTPNIPMGTRVRVSGIYQDVFAEDGSRIPGMLLVSSWHAVRPVPASEQGIAMIIRNEAATNQLAGGTASEGETLPTITAASEVKALTTEMAKQKLPVKVRGVITAVQPDFLYGAVLQDSTKGIYISLEDISVLRPLRLGEFYEIEGVSSPGAFAPIVVARRITHLGPGFYPEPLHATWDQLRNGSLDTQYAEIEGVVTAVHDQRIELLTKGGLIGLVLDDLQPEDLADYENALVQIRGCALALFNMETRELDASSLRILGGVIDVLKPAPHDLFDAPQKSLGELLLYDPKAAPFRRLRVSGQVIYHRAGECFLSDGTNGLRVTPRSTETLAVGDFADAVGFLELGGPAVELNEAIMRKTGHGPLPTPVRPTPEHLLDARYAGTLVQVDATLMNQWREGSDHVLELQSGFLAFGARISSHGNSISLPPSGSRLRLTGVYAPQGKRSESGNVSGFDILMASPAGLRVLATPPWWTLTRVLIVVGILAILLGGLLVWNKELHWKVQERGRQLELEIRNRQRAELQRAAEAERTRIARDLHDELGTGLTEVSLLASSGLGDAREVREKNDLFRGIAEKSRALVAGLDVIVWAIDPRRNSLQSFADYLGRYATEVFSAAGIVCRFKIPIECKAVSLTEGARHSLFLAVKETLNNIIRHAAATEVRLQMTQNDDHLEIVIADNGRGFDWNTIHRGNGLTNLQERLKSLNGQCHIESQPGTGTTVKFTVPLAYCPD